MPTQQPLCGLCQGQKYLRVTLTVDDEENSGNIPIECTLCHGTGRTKWTAACVVCGGDYMDGDLLLASEDGAIHISHPEGEALAPKVAIGRLL